MRPHKSFPADVRFTRWNIGLMAILGVLLVLTGAGVVGFWDGLTEGHVSHESWFNALITLLSAAVAALVAMLVLGVQRRQQDERQRLTNEVDAAAALAAHIHSVWYIGNSKSEILEDAADFTLPSNAWPELHRLTAAWVSHLDSATMDQAQVKQIEVLQAILTFGEHVAASLANGRDVVANQIIQGMGVETERDLVFCHDQLQEVGRSIVVMHWYGVDERGTFLADWSRVSKALPLHLQFVGTHYDRIVEKPEDSEPTSGISG